MLPTSTTLPAQIDVWREANSETPNLEFKEAKTQYDNEKLFEYCVAIANEGGGYLILGISNIPPRPVVGTSAFRDPQKMEEKIFSNVGFRVRMEEVAHPEGRVLICHIPSRPRGTAYHRDGKYLMRCGESLMPMSEDQLRQIFSEGMPNWLEEFTRRTVSVGEIVASLDLDSYFKVAGIPSPADSRAALDRFIMEGLLIESNGQYSIPRITALLFANDLTAFPELARKAPRVIVL